MAINDDYVKFIRMSEHLIGKNPAGGVLGFITNHGYLDNPTFSRDAVASAARRSTRFACSTCTGMRRRRRQP